jgi:hypothetical protein
VNTVLNFLGSIKGEEFLDQLSTEHRYAELPIVTNCKGSNENRSGTVLIGGLETVKAAKNSADGQCQTSIVNMCISVTNLLVAC